MVNLAHLMVKADAPMQTVVHPVNKAVDKLLQDGQVLVHISKIIVTANTLTYAHMGKWPVVRYFKNYQIPSDAPSDLAFCPCWGTGVVVESKCPDVKVGTRIHGFFTFSPTVILTPTNVTATTFIDGSPHRTEILVPYKQFYSHDDPLYKGQSYDEEDYQVGTGNLFSTGWSMAQVAALHPAKPTALIITSASSRTSRAAAFTAKFHNLPLERIGITSAENIAYVRGLGIYDTVCTYSDIGSLPKQKVAVQDVAGNNEVQESLYKHFGDNVVYYGSVGISHIGSAGKVAKLDGLGGTRPVDFFVFPELEKVWKVYGNKKSLELFFSCWEVYHKEMKKYFQAERHYGAEETQAIYQATAQGKANSKITYVCSMWPKELHEPVVRSKL